MQTMDYRSAPVRTHPAAATVRSSQAATSANGRPLPGTGMTTGTSLSPEDIRRIVADMVG